MIHIFTSAAPNYLGKVKTLFHSLKEHHPEFVLHLLLVERRSEDLGQELDFFDDVIFATDFEMGRDPGWLFSHSLVELSTALKGMATLYLLEDLDAGQVLYFDPDIVLFSRIDEILDALQESSLVLTPHLLQPESDPDAILDNEICSLKHGIFNLGFLGVNQCPEGRRFAEWWSHRLTHFCQDDIAGGLFTDQRWIDFSPVFFENATIVRETRFNVAPWNINQRSLAGSFDLGFTVDGEPLGFYHFTGLDSGAHDAVIEKYAPDNRAIKMLIQWYKLRTAKLSPIGDHRWELGHYDNGDPIRLIHRRIYRQRQDLQAAFPDPFQVRGSAASYLSWLEIEGIKEYTDLFTNPED